MNNNNNKPALSLTKGFPQAKHTKKKSNIMIAFSVILALHAVVLGIFLIQGCKQEPAPGSSVPAPDSPVVANESEITTKTNEVVEAKDPVLAPAVTPSVVNTNVVITNQAPALVIDTNPVPAPSPVAVDAPNTNTLPPAPVSPAPVITNNPVVPPPVSTNTDTKAPTATTNVYKIKSGDTMSKIAAQYGVNLNDLLKANPKVNPKKMQIGQEITIPAPKPKSTTTTQKTNTAKAPVTLGADQYKIVSGDTLGKIAKKFKVTVPDLKRANNLDSDAIRVGQILKIPAATAQKTVVPQTTNTTTKTPASVVATPSTPVPSTPVPTPTTTPKIQQLPSAKDIVGYKTAPLESQ